MLNISVLVTCYNKEKYLSDCVSSVLRQTKNPKEIIIVHDGCDEPMAHVGADTIILKANKGVAGARDVAFKYSTGALILFVDGDDVLDPDYLEKMTWVIGKRNADIAFPDMYMWGGEETKLVKIPNKINPKFIRTFHKIVIPVTCLMKREVYQKVGGFREWPVLEDVDFWVRAMCNGYIFKKAETLLWYRRTPDTRNSSMEITKRKQIMNKILGQFEFEGDTIKFKKGGVIDGETQL
jgi:glycosyltransferase involved in cell wall biosynthesis